MLIPDVRVIEYRYLFLPDVGIELCVEYEQRQRDQRFDRFMVRLDTEGEDEAIRVFGDPSQWDECRHGQARCRYGGYPHRAGACIHEAAPTFKSTHCGTQTELFQ